MVRWQDEWVIGQKLSRAEEIVSILEWCGVEYCITCQQLRRELSELPGGEALR